MIAITLSQKQVVLKFFDDDIKVVKKYFNAIGFDLTKIFALMCSKSSSTPPQECLKISILLFITKN